MKKSGWVVLHPTYGAAMFEDRSWADAQFADWNSTNEATIRECWICTEEGGRKFWLPL